MPQHTLESAGASRSARAAALRAAGVVALGALAVFAYLLYDTRQQMHEIRERLGTHAAVTALQSANEAPGAGPGAAQVIAELRAMEQELKACIEDLRRRLEAEQPSPLIVPTCT